MDRLAPDEPSIPLKDREGTISTPFRKIFAIICLSPVSPGFSDESESPVWRDYCLQFLSECLKSSSDPEAIKSLLTRYAQGKDGLAGTAIVNVGLQEAAGRIKPGETFSPR
jgi:hypothetical protein